MGNASSKLPERRHLFLMDHTSLDSGTFSQKRFFFGHQTPFFELGQGVGNESTE